MVASVADTSQTFVVSPFSRFGEVPTIQALSDMGLFNSNEAFGDLALAKRMNRMCWADFSKETLSADAQKQAAMQKQIADLQAACRAKIAGATDFNALVASGELNGLLNQYMDFLIERAGERIKRLETGAPSNADESEAGSLKHLIEAERKNHHDLSRERETYKNDAAYTQQALLRIEKLVKIGSYKPLGLLVMESGFVKDATTPAMARDMVSDAMGVLTARQICSFADQFRYVDALRNQPDAKVHYDTIALAVRDATMPVSALFGFEPVHPDLDRLTALRNLVSAQLHRAFSQPDMTTQKEAALEKIAKDISAEYAQVAMSLAYDYLGEGESAADPRVKALRESVKAEAQKKGITLIEDKKIACEAARKLAQISAQDLLGATQDQPLLADGIKKLASCAGVAVDKLVLDPQIIPKEVDLADPRFHVNGLTPEMIAAAQARTTAALLGTGARPSGHVDRLEQELSVGQLARN